MALLSPFSVAYEATARLRVWCYSAGLFRTARLNVPVISIGNLTMGGTGKTPTTIALGKILQDSGRRVSILLRGYKGRRRGGPLVVSDGKQIRSTAPEAGDEALVIARNLPRAVVAVCKDRAAAGAMVEQEFHPDVHLLDDGFQHLQLHRDLNLLVIDVTNPFGGGLPPSGRLREPLNAIQRADALLLSRTESGQECEELVAQALVHKPALPCFMVRQRLVSARKLDESVAFSLATLRGFKALAFAGIANPGQFFRSVEQRGIHLSRCISLPDHHDYRVRDYQRLKSEAAEYDVSTLVTTEKDAEKLNAAALAPLDVVVLRVAFEFDDLQGIIRLLENTVGAFAR